MWNPDQSLLGGATVLDGTPAESTTLVGSVSGLLDVPAGVTVDIHGVLEDAVLSGGGTVRVSGLLAEVIRMGSGEVLASVGSVVAPLEADGPWLLLQPYGTWAELSEPVFPISAVDSEDGLASLVAALGGGATIDLDWYPVLRD